MKFRVFALVMLLVIVISAGSVFAQDGTLADVLAGDENFSTFVSLVEAAELTETLSGEEPFTVFAPTNAAFEALPQVVLDYLSSNPEALTRVLNYHVVSGSVMSADLLGMIDENGSSSVTTLEGGNLTVRVQGDTATVDQANIDVSMIDQTVSNGVIHVIDALLLPTFELPSVDPAALVAGTVVTAGSSTVFPISQRLADLVSEEYGGDVTVDSIGSGAGFERFCVNVESDISNASDPMPQNRREECEANGLEVLEFVIAFDPLAVAVSDENEFVQNLTIEQLRQAFSIGNGGTWADIDPAFPAEPIQLYSPGTDSGTFSFFVEHVMEDNQELILDAPGIGLSEDDNVLVQGILGSPYAIGYFGFAYYLENLETLRTVAIEGVNPENPEGQDYVLNRPLFIYSAPSVIQSKPQVAAFLNYYLTYVDSQLLGGGSNEAIGYNPVSSYRMNYNRLLLLAAVGDGI